VVVTKGGSVYTTASKVSSTSTSVITNPASLSQNGSSSSSGMSSKTRNTIIGVVVGVGGAIILTGLSIVAWRIWGRRRAEDESDGLMGFRRNSGGPEKSNSVGGGSSPNPFQSTLENYHNPSMQVNASSNF
jgi:hypothetical protein